MKPHRLGNFENLFPVKSMMADNGPKCKVVSVFDPIRISAAIAWNYM